MKKQTILLLVAVAMLAHISLPLYAGSWNWSKPYKNPEKRVNTLIVVGNYIKPRLMADLIQIETKQPILLLPTSVSGKIYFIPAKDETLQVPYEDMQSFIKYLGPGKIIVLGGKQFVLDKFIKKIDPAQTVIRVENEKWEKIAVMVSNILNLTFLERRYKKYEAKIDSGELYRPDWADSIENADTAPAATQPKDDLIVEETLIVDDDKNAARSKTDNAGDVKTASEPKLIDDTKVVPK